jgi:tetratricopeptide (TPR) repeat protein
METAGGSVKVSCPPTVLLALLLGCAPVETAPRGATSAKPAATAPEEEAAEDEHEPDVDGIVTRAEHAVEAKDWALAEKLAKQAIELDAAGYPYAYVVLGDVAFAKGDHARALVLFRKALALDPNDGWATLRAADALGELDRNEEARQMLRAFVASHADAEADVFDALGASELEQGDVARAEAAYRRALDRSGGKDADALYGVALVAARRGKASETARALAALLTLDPERRDEVRRDERFRKVLGAKSVRAVLRAK